MAIASARPRHFGRDHGSQLPGVGARSRRSRSESASRPAGTFADSSMRVDCTPRAPAMGEEQPARPTQPPKAFNR
jgi:hypothetical protein